MAMIQAQTARNVHMFPCACLNSQNAACWPDHWLDQEHIYGERRCQKQSAEKGDDDDVVDSGVVLTCQAQLPSPPCPQSPGWQSAKALTTGPQAACHDPLGLPASERLGDPSCKPRCLLCAPLRHSNHSKQSGLRPLDDACRLFWWTGKQGQRFQCPDEHPTGQAR